MESTEWTRERKTALITGITGQDGSYLAEFLLNKGYRVLGLKRRTSLISTDRINHIYNHPSFEMHYSSMIDPGSLYRIISQEHPDEIYNLAAQSHVRVSFETPEETAQIVGMGTLRLLEAVLNVNPDIKLYQASSSEMFGDNPAVPQSEETQFMPASPYACSKVFAHNLVRNYRKSYGIHASCGLYLGNLDAKRDWGFAGDYVEAMWKMLQQDSPDDFVIATGETHTVREFLEAVFNHADLQVHKYVDVDTRLFRPHEVPVLLGDPSKAERELNWRPTVTFDKLAKMMYESDLQLVKEQINGKREKK